MQYDVIRATELTPGQEALWSELQSSAPELESPYLTPEFTRAVSQVRGDVWVAILHNGGRIQGFFPYQRTALGIGRPVGGPLCDVHGVVCSPEVDFDAHDLLAACRLASYSFTHLVAWQRPFEQQPGQVGESYFIDLAGGYDGYVAALRARGSHLVKSARQDLRYLERLGPVRFVPHDANPEPLRTLFEWKSRQYRETGLTDVFSFGWTRDLLALIHGIQKPQLAGMLSVLYVGSDLAAIHFGMRSAVVWNWWFPRHEERFAKYSPGILLCVRAAQHADSIGIRRIDLGYGGDAPYKDRLVTGTFRLAAGRVERPCAVTSVMSVMSAVESSVRRNEKLGRLARVPGRWIRNFGRRLHFR